jgi:hypothetical protein
MHTSYATRDSRKQVEIVAVSVEVTAVAVAAAVLFVQQFPGFSAELLLCCCYQAGTVCFTGETKLAQMYINICVPHRCMTSKPLCCTGITTNSLHNLRTCITGAQHPECQHCHRDLAVPLGSGAGYGACAHGHHEAIGGEPTT